MEVKNTDILCIGGGGAGVTAAVFAADEGADVTIISKDPIGYGNTRISMGLMAQAFLCEEDSGNQFLEDILYSGENLNQRNLAKRVAEESQVATKVIENFGQIFLRDEEGKLSKECAMKLGGHRYARSLISPSEGISLGHALRSAVASTENLHVSEDTLAVKILADDSGVKAVICYNLVDNKFVVYRARAVVLATGGTSWLYYPHTGNNRTATGDGYALALEAGAELIDMEQIQFVPFAATHPKSMMGLGLGEPATAGPYGRLLNSRGEVILENINTRTRAEVAKAIAVEVEKGNTSKWGGLTLDLSPNLSYKDGVETRSKLRSMAASEVVRRVYGEEAYAWEKAWDVLPCAHTSLGGVKVDNEGGSNVRGLYAAGEVIGGVHGSNRLGSVALTELFVMGKHAGEAAGKYAKEQSTSSEKNVLEEEFTKDIESLKRYWHKRGIHRPVTLKRRLQRMMWERVGLVRDEKKLRSALDEANVIEGELGNLSVPDTGQYNLGILDTLELRLMILTAKAIALSALKRKETKGAHVRGDYTDKGQLKENYNTIVWMEKNKIKVRKIVL